MIQLLQIEWLKVRSYRAFWWLLGITLFSYVGGTLVMTSVYGQVLDRAQMSPEAVTSLLGSNPFSIGEVWHTMGYVFSLLITIPALLIIMLISNEYTFGTYKQNIINGWSRNQALTAKLGDVLVLSVVITAVYVGICLVIANVLGGGNVGGAGTETAGKHYFIACFFLQTLAQLSIAFMLGYFLRRSFLALIVFICWPLILEPILSQVLARGGLEVGAFLPFELSDRLIPPPAFVARVDPERYEAAMSGIGVHAIYTLVFTLLVWALCYRVNRVRNL